MLEPFSTDDGWVLSNSIAASTIDAASIRGASGPLIVIGHASIAVRAADGRALVTLSTHDGTLQYGEGYDPDEAARTFWQAWADAFPGMLRD